MSQPKSHRPGHAHHLIGYLFAAIAFVTCPCHLPILAVLLAGTTAGAILSAHFALSALILVIIFATSLAIAVTAFKRRS